MLAPPMLAWSKFALRRSAPLKLVNSSCEREKKAPARLVSWNTSARRSQLEKSMRSEEHTSELQSLMRISYAVFCLKKKIQSRAHHNNQNEHRETHIHQPRDHVNSDIERTEE